MGKLIIGVMIAFIMLVLIGGYRPRLSANGGSDSAIMAGVGDNGQGPMMESSQMAAGGEDGNMVAFAETWGAKPNAAQLTSVGPNKPLPKDDCGLQAQKGKLFEETGF